MSKDVWAVGRPPIETVSMPRTYREGRPSGHYDLVIVSLVHQSADMVKYLAANLQKYVKGAFLWVVHYNHSDFIDERELPDFAWLHREPIETRAFTRSITHAVCRCMQFALETTTCVNFLMMSSGSSFFREYRVPITPYIAFYSPEYLLNDGKILLHQEPIPMGKANGRGWHWNVFSTDDHVNELFTRRGFRWLRGGQFSGTMFPCEVGMQLAYDFMTIEKKLFDPFIHDYPGEEIHFATYAYNYAVERGLTIHPSETIISWGAGYNIESPDTIRAYREAARVFPGMGHIVCKLAEWTWHPVRAFLNGDAV